MNDETYTPPNWDALAARRRDLLADIEASILGWRPVGGKT